MTDQGIGPGMAVNMTQCGPWITAGLKRFEVVENSWFVFRNNANELIAFLNIPASHTGEFLRVVTSGPNESRPFWGTFNQRLHNFLASVVSLVDHARRLTRYYEDDAPEFVSRFGLWNRTIADLPESQFLRELRNFMLHCAQPPLITHIPLSDSLLPRIRFDAKELLRQSERPWSSASRHYLEEFRDVSGPDILDIVERYAKEMDDLFKWLFEQRISLANLAPERFWVAYPAED